MTFFKSILLQKNVIRVVLLFCILLVFYLFGKMSAILHRNPKFALFEKFFPRLKRKEFWLSKNIQIWQGDYKIAKKFQSMLVRNASFDAIDLGLICPCYSSRSMYVMHISSSMISLLWKNSKLGRLLPKSEIFFTFFDTISYIGPIFVSSISSILFTFRKKLTWW